MGKKLGKGAVGGGGKQGTGETKSQHSGPMVFKKEKHQQVTSGRRPTLLGVPNDKGGRLLFKSWEKKRPS